MISTYQCAVCGKITEFGEIHLTEFCTAKKKFYCQKEETMSRVPTIKPDEMVQKKFEDLPDEAIRAFNEMITKNWNGSSSQFAQKEVVALIVLRMNVDRPVDKHVTSQTIYNNHWADIEDIYRRDGWKVIYDKAAYNETYDSFFVFSK